MTLKVAMEWNGEDARARLTVNGYELEGPPFGVERVFELLNELNFALDKHEKRGIRHLEWLTQIAKELRHDWREAADG